MMGVRLFSRIALCALLATLAACNDSASDDAASGAGASVDSSDPNTVAERAATETPQTGLVLSCPAATATVQFAACPGGQLVYVVPSAGVYVESSTVATTDVPAYGAATHVFQPYQNAVEVVICQIAETPGVAVTYTTDPCTMNHGVAAGPAAGGSSSSGGGSSSSSSSSSGASTVPQIGLVLSCPTATATVQFAACPGGQLVYAVPATGVYVESSTAATTTAPAFSAATHVFQPYQNAVEVVICTIAETPGLTVTYSTDPCTLYHGVVAGPGAGGSSSSGASTSSSSSGGVPSGSSSGATSSSGSSSGASSSSGGSSSGSPSSSGSSSSSGGSSATTDVLTYHNDTMRTGQNLTETVLTPRNVNSSTFGLLYQLAADDLVSATPVVASNVSINGVLHNVVYVASESDSVYAYDADTGALLKHVSVLGTGELPSDDRGCAQDGPNIGITATPVIDRSAGPNGTIFVEAMSKDSSNNYYQRLHALDLATLADRITPVTIQATYPGTAYGATGQVAFVPGQYTERGALLLSHGQIVTVWAGHCDTGQYDSWIIAYNESLTQTQVLNLTPNGNQGGIWDAAGAAADNAGALYSLIGNGLFDVTLTNSGFPVNGDYGNAAIKLSLSSASGSLQVTDYFTMWDTTTESQDDVDLGSGSPLLLPDMADSTGTTRQLMLAVGKDTNFYLLDRHNLGKYNGNASGSDTVYQELDGVLSAALLASPVYFNGSIYLAEIGGTLKQFALSAARLPATPTSKSSATFAFPGASPSISANGTSNAIVWAVMSNPGSAAVLHAYNPANLATEYYNSTQAAGGRDAFGNGNKFITAVVAHGKVFVGTRNGVAVFGLL
jgi:hypothetical protein